jgi:copper(I)-binding protein
MKRMAKKIRWQLVLVIGLALVFAVVGYLSSRGGPSISVENAYGLPLPETTGTGSFYMSIKNSGGTADKLTAASSPACGRVDLHETSLGSDGMMGMDSMTGGGVVIPAGSQVELKSGALHLMCVDKQANQFTAGSKIEVTLVFEKSGQINVSAEIREK